MPDVSAEEMMENMMGRAVKHGIRQYRELYEKQTPWHLRKEITIGNVMASVVIFFSAIGAYYHQDKRITLAEQSIQFNVAQIEAQKKTTRNDFVEVKGMLRDISNKLDRKADK